VSRHQAVAELSFVLIYTENRFVFVGLITCRRSMNCTHCWMNCMSLQVSVRCHIATFIMSERLLSYTYFYLNC